MKKLIIISTLLTVAISTFSVQSNAVQFHTIDCGNGKNIKVTDSEYNPATNALLCLKAAQKESNANNKRKPVFAHANQRTNTMKQEFLRAGSSTSNSSSTVDHSDIILMLQGCECISPSCVAYTCPVDTKVP